MPIIQCPENLLHHIGMTWRRCALSVLVTATIERLRVLTVFPRCNLNLTVVSDGTEFKAIVSVDETSGQQGSVYQSKNIGVVVLVKYPFICHNMLGPSTSRMVGAWAAGGSEPHRGGTESLV